MRVRLKVKLAEVVEGVDLSPYTEGDVIEISERDGRLLISGGWAEHVPEEERVQVAPKWHPGIAADRSS
jgi:hypothetical protein